MWPFRKKEKIYRENLFIPLTSTKLGWSEIYTDQQNSDLLIKYFNSVAEIAAPVMKYADGIAQTYFVTNEPEVERLLNKPNYFQGWNEFVSQSMIYYRLLGNSIINAFAPIALDGRKPKALYNLAPQYVGIKTNENKDFRFEEIQYYLFDSGETKKGVINIEPEYILHLKESNPNFRNNQYLFGISRYASCYKNIESISSGYDAKKNLYKNGARLIITGKPQGEFASANEIEETEELHKRFKEYGYREQDKNAFLTTVPLDVYNVSFNVRDLQINENNASDFQRLCDSQNIDDKCFSVTSTFTNKEAALYDFYNNAFRSVVDGWFHDLRNFLRKWWPNLELEPDYSQISEINKANAEENKRILEDAKLGLRTRNEYLEATGQEAVNQQGYNEYYTYNGTYWQPNNVKNDTQEIQE